MNLCLKQAFVSGESMLVACTVVGPMVSVVKWVISQCVWTRGHSGVLLWAPGSPQVSVATQLSFLGSGRAGVGGVRLRTGDDKLVHLG